MDEVRVVGRRERMTSSREEMMEVKLRLGKDEKRAREAGIMLDIKVVIQLSYYCRDVKSGRSGRYICAIFSQLVLIFGIISRHAQYDSGTSAISTGHWCF